MPARPFFGISTRTRRTTRCAVFAREPTGYTISADPSATAVDMAISVQQTLRRTLKPFAILLGFAFSSAVLAHGQTLQHSSPPSQHSASAVSSAPNSRASSLANAPSAPVARDFSDRDFMRQRAEQQSTTDNLRTLKSSLFRTTKTPFVTQSRLPLGPLAGSRLQLNFDMTSTNNRSLIAGPLVPPQTTEAAFAQGRTDDRYGVSLSIPLGRGAESAASKGLFSGISRAFRQRK
jgi:hypothetical protein